jgi:hypothetical protein
MVCRPWDCQPYKGATYYAIKLLRRLKGPHYLGAHRERGRKLRSAKAGGSLPQVETGPYLRQPRAKESPAVWRGMHSGVVSSEMPMRVDAVLIPAASANLLISGILLRRQFARFCSSYEIFSFRPSIVSCTSAGVPEVAAAEYSPDVRPRRRQQKRFARPREARTRADLSMIMRRCVLRQEHFAGLRLPCSPQPSRLRQIPFRGLAAEPTKFSSVGNQSSRQLPARSPSASDPAEPISMAIERIAPAQLIGCQWIASVSAKCEA